MVDTEFYKECIELEVNKMLKKDSLTFEELFNLNYPAKYIENPSLRFIWSKFTIHAYTKKKIISKFEKKTINKGMKVRVWMISRLGDVGITDNLINAIGYDARVDITNLENFEIIKQQELKI